jgi:hypothetical protein
VENRKVPWTNGVLDDTHRSHRRQRHAAKTRSKRRHGQKRKTRTKARKLHLRRRHRRVNKQSKKARRKNSYAEAASPQRRMDSHSHRPRRKPHRPNTTNTHVTPSSFFRFSRLHQLSSRFFHILHESNSTYEKSCTVQAELTPQAQRP